MWSPQVMIYHTAPVVVATVGMYLLYRATQVEGSQADRAFATGMILVLASWGFTAARSSRKRSTLASDLEDKNQALCIRVRELERDLNTLRQDVHSKIAIKTWLQAMDRLDEHHATSWVNFKKDDSSR